MRKDKPIGVTMDWGGNPTLAFSDGCIYPKQVEQILYKEYYPNGQQWPVDPETGDELPIAHRPGRNKEPLLSVKAFLWICAGLMALMITLFCFYG